MDDLGVPPCMETPTSVSSMGRPKAMQYRSMAERKTETMQKSQVQTLQRKHSMSGHPDRTKFANQGIGLQNSPNHCLRDPMIPT